MMPALVAFGGVPGLDGMKQTELADIIILLGPTSVPRDVLGDALIRRASNKEGLYKQIRYQRKGTELRKLASTVLGTKTGAHLNGRKLEQLGVLIENTRPEFANVQQFTGMAVYGQRPR